MLVNENLIYTKGLEKAYTEYTSAKNTLSSHSEELKQIQADLLKKYLPSYLVFSAFALLGYPQDTTKKLEITILQEQMKKEFAIQNMQFELERTPGKHALDSITVSSNPGSSNLLKLTYHPIIKDEPFTFTTSIPDTLVELAVVENQTRMIQFNGQLHPATVLVSKPFTIDVTTPVGGVLKHTSHIIDPRKTTSGTLFRNLF